MLADENQLMIDNAFISIKKKKKNIPRPNFDGKAKQYIYYYYKRYIIETWRYFRSNAVGLVMFMYFFSS